MRSLPTSKQLNLQVGVAGLGAGVACAALIATYVQLVIHLSAEHVSLLWWLIGLVVGVVSVISELLKRQRLGKILYYLDHREDGTLTEQDREQAFLHSIHFPAWLVTYSFFGWVVMGSAISYTLDWRFADLSTYSATLMTISAIVGGFLSQTFVYLVVKLMLEPVKQVLALEVADPDLRARLVVPVSISRKMMTDMCGLMLAVTFLSVTLSNSRAMRSASAVVYQQQSVVIANFVAALDAAPDFVALQKQSSQRYGEMGVELIVFGADLDTVLAGDASVLVREEREWLQRTAFLETSDAQAAADAELATKNGEYDSPHLLSWSRTTPEGPVVVGLSAREHLRADGGSENVFILLLTLFSVGTAFVLAQMVAADFRRDVRSLRSEVERIARGDFRRSSVFESENEHGDLGRDMDRMLGALRRTVRRVLQRAGQVQSDGAQIRVAAEAVLESSTKQRAGVGEAVAAMDNVNQLVTEIGDLANGLTAAVDTSSRTIDSLRVSSTGLSEGGMTLASQVEETGSSIAELTRSIQNVAEEAQDLVLGVTETSSSVEEISSALRAVDRNAAETQKLSTEVLEVAEVGREKVAETIRGIEAIRSATEQAEAVMQRLGERSQGIGTIVQVINNIADETNLLALNAAIIAAQAGEQGRAFSVVADEIKDLADRVLLSTKEIASLVGHLQQESALAAQSIAAGSASVHSGVERAAAAGQALERITGAARESGERMQHVVQAVSEQSTAAMHMVELMERVRLGVDDIHRATQQQTKSANSVHRSAELMKDVAVQVRSAVDTQNRDHSVIQQDVESVSQSTKRIVEKLVQQSDACAHAAQVLDLVVQRVVGNQESVADVQKALDALLQQADLLRKDAEEFQV